MLHLVFASLLCLAAFSNAQDSNLVLSGVTEFRTVPVFEQSVDLVASFEAPPSVADSDRSAVSIIAVLDRSGSMLGPKIDLLKRSTEFLVERLEDGDYLGVVSYASDVRTDVQLSPISSSTTSNSLAAIEEINAEGNTNLSGGLFTAVRQQAEGDLPANIVKSIILFTDGLANRGITDVGEITAELSQNLDVRNPPTIYALGFGGDHNANFLSAIAETGGGSYIFVADESDIAGAIGEILGGLLTVTAQDIVISFEPLSGARIVNVRGGNVNADMTQTTFSDLFAEERRDILVEMRVPVEDDALENQEILRVTLSYFNTIEGEREFDEITISIDRSLDVVETRPEALVEQTKLRFQVADDIETAVAQREAGDVEGASDTLQGTLDTIEASSESDSPEAQALAADVRTTKEDVESDDFDEEEGNRATAGAEAVARQRSGGSSTGFTSARATSAQLSASAEAEDFVGK